MGNQPSKPDERKSGNGARGFSAIRNDFLRSPARRKRKAGEGAPRRLSREAKFIAALYVSFSDRSGRLWPSLDKLVVASGFCRDRVKAARKELIDSGLLMQDRERSHGRYKKMAYWISPSIRWSRANGSDPLAHHSTGFQYRGDDPHHSTGIPAPVKTAAGVSVSEEEPVSQSESKSVLNKNKPKSENPASERLSRTDSDGDKFKSPRSEGKTLSEVLVIDKSRLRNKELVGMNILERQFEHVRPPKEREALALWLDDKLKWMKGEGHVYPKAILLRLKQLQRGTFTKVHAELCDTGASAGDAIRETDVRRVLRSHLRALWEPWTRPAQNGSYADQCQLFLETARKKGFELNAEELEALERGASAPNVGGGL